MGYFALPCNQSTYQFIIKISDFCLDNWAIILWQLKRYNSFWIPKNNFSFYDNSILSGTKIKMTIGFFLNRFYDNSILSGTKMAVHTCFLFCRFYDNSILSGTKMLKTMKRLKLQFYDNSILSGTKILSAALLLP